MRKVFSVAVLLALGFLSTNSAMAGSLLSARSGRMVFACRQGMPVTVDFDKHTVTDSISDAPVAAQITADTIKWHNEFTAYQFDPHYGGQYVNHTADHMLDRHTGRLNGADTCGADQN
jgi:hypothetical protein